MGQPLFNNYTLFRALSEPFRINGNAGHHRLNELKFEKGLALVLGFIDGNEKLIMHDAGVGVGEDAITIDWLFY